MFGRENSLERANLAIGRLEDDLKLISARVDELKSANKTLQLEWTETYDKVRHQLSRMARRGTLDTTPNDVPIIPPEGSDEVVLDPISAKIHARRNSGFLGRD